MSQTPGDHLEAQFERWSTTFLLKLRLKNGASAHAAHFATDNIFICGSYETVDALLCLMKAMEMIRPDEPIQKDVTVFADDPENG